MQFCLLDCFSDNKYNESYICLSNISLKKATRDPIQTVYRKYY